MRHEVTERHELFLDPPERFRVSWISATGKAVTMFVEQVGFVVKPGPRRGPQHGYVYCHGPRLLKSGKLSDRTFAHSCHPRYEPAAWDQIPQDTREEMARLGYVDPTVPVVPE